MTDLQKAIDGQQTELESKEKGLATLRERLNALEAQLTRETERAAQSIARATTEQQTLEVTVTTLRKEAGDREATIKVGTTTTCITVYSTDIMYSLYYYKHSIH